MGSTRSDFSDAGYGQVGCLLIAVGIVAGLVVALVLSFLVADPGTGNPNGTLQLAGILALGTLVGILAAGAAMKVVERMPPLWPAADAIVFAVPPVIAGVVVVAAVVVGPVAAIAVPVGLGGSAVLIVGLLVLSGVAALGRRGRS